MACSLCVQSLIICMYLQNWLITISHQNNYCKSTNFGVLLYLANLANCVFLLIFVSANIRCSRHQANTIKAYESNGLSLLFLDKEAILLLLTIL